VNKSWNYQIANTVMLMLLTAWICLDTNHVICFAKSSYMGRSMHLYMISSPTLLDPGMEYTFANSTS
jgi:hypothetical protein